MAKKKMNYFTSLFKHKEKASSWLWPACTNPRTDSFRTPQPHHMYKTLNSVYFNITETTSESSSFLTESDESGGESMVMPICGLRSERFFFEPGESRSILGVAKVGGYLVDESVVLEMESEDPYSDFRVSMEEMVEASGLKDWECLEELFLWYLRMNGKETHGFIVGAFVDLLVGMLSASSFDKCKEEISLSLRLEFNEV